MGAAGNWKSRTFTSSSLSRPFVLSSILIFDWTAPGPGCLRPEPVDELLQLLPFSLVVDRVFSYTSSSWRICW